MVDLIGQYNQIKEEIDTTIAETLNTGMYIGGEKVKTFSENLANYLHVNHVIPCGNGTDALQLALMALDLKPGDEVITTPFTFVATAEVIKLLGLKAIFVDIEPDSYNIDPIKIEEAITPNTKCIIPVHLFGQTANMDAIMKIADNHNLFVIEDNAQAIGSNVIVKGEKFKSGTIGHIGTTSFFPSKNLGAFGDGGAVFTNDPELARKIKLFGNHGSSKKYYYESIGINSRLDALQAGILDVKLKYLDSYISARNIAADRYDKLFLGTDDIKIPYRVEYSDHVFHQYTLRIKEHRDAVAEALKENKIPFGIYYPQSLHHSEAYKESRDFHCPVSDQACKEVISLPMHTELTEEIQSHIAKIVLEIVK